ncbi:MAG: hypothetical protein AB7S81_03700 [Bdellovibrionales bacterium]
MAKELQKNQFTETADRVRAQGEALTRKLPSNADCSIYPSIGYTVGFVKAYQLIFVSAMDVIQEAYPDFDEKRMQNAKNVAEKATQMMVVFERLLTGVNDIIDNDKDPTAGVANLLGQCKKEVLNSPKNMGYDFKFLSYLSKTFFVKERTRDQRRLLRNAIEVFEVINPSIEGTYNLRSHWCNNGLQ